MPAGFDSIIGVVVLEDVGGKGVVVLVGIDADATIGTDGECRW